MLAIPGFFSGIGPMEILVILVIALVLFGNRLPEVAKTLGKGYLEFRRGLKNLENSIDFDADPQKVQPRQSESPRALLKGEVVKPAEPGTEKASGTEPKPDAGGMQDGGPENRG